VNEKPNKVVTLTEEQAEIIRRSLRVSAERAAEKGREAVAKDLHDAAEAKAFYDKLEAEYLSTLDILGKETAEEDDEDDEDICPDCGEDYGFCQCHEDD